MATWGTALTELRTILADTSADNLVKEQQLLGVTNGQNSTFYTFQDRIIASGNQSVCGTPLRVWVNNVEIPSSGIVVTDQIRGEINLLYVMVSGSTSVGSPRLKTSYYFQQNLDDELNLFLTQAANYVSLADITKTPPGLQQSVLMFAAATAHTRLAQRWQLRKSEQFMLQDEPMRQEAESLIKFHQDQAKACRADASTLRRDYYEFRQDQGRQAAFGTLYRTPPPWTPRR